MVCSDNAFFGKAIVEYMLVNTGGRMYKAECANDVFVISNMSFLGLS